MNRISLIEAKGRAMTDKNRIPEDVAMQLLQIAVEVNREYNKVELPSTIEMVKKGYLGLIEQAEAPNIDVTISVRIEK